MCVSSRNTENAATISTKKTPSGTTPHLLQNEWEQPLSAICIVELWKLRCGFAKQPLSNISNLLNFSADIFLIVLLRNSGHLKRMKYVAYRQTFGSPVLSKK